MENADREVLSQLTGWIEAGERCWLCTVVKTWGSSPRPIGSLLCCNSRGQIAGSLSGGCIEDDLLEKLQTGELATDRPMLHIYGASAEDADRFNLPCGGQLHIVIEPFVDRTCLPDFQHIVERLSARQCVARSVDITTGEMVVEDRERYQNLVFEGDFVNADDTGVAGERRLSQTYGPRFQLFLIGASQVSMYLGELAQKLDYHVVVCDPRENMIDDWKVPGVQLVNDMPDDAVRRMADNFTAVIALTHDPRIDDMGLMEALTTDAWFVGAMGSTRTSAKRRERLLQLDLTEDQIARLHAPVGLPIGSKTPAEIAVSILAQLIALRAEAKPDKLAADYRTLAVG
ncbi:MAG: XdhC family protein [Pseudomonadota bacterium]